MFGSMRGRSTHSSSIMLPIMPNFLATSTATVNSSPSLDRSTIFSSSSAAVNGSAGYFLADEEAASAVSSAGFFSSDDDITTRLEVTTRWAMAYG